MSSVMAAGGEIKFGLDLAVIDIERVLSGPDLGELNGLMCRWVGERTARNSVVYDLAHGVELAVEGIRAGLGERIRFSGMRRDFRGLSPLHILAIQGKIELLKALLPAVIEKVGGRSLLHFAALGGHLRTAMLPLMPFDCSPKEQDEYGGTPGNIDTLVKEQRCQSFHGKWKVSGTHIPAQELLKLWLGAAPRSVYIAQKEMCKKIMSGITICAGDVIEVSCAPEKGLGSQALAKINIAAFTSICRYEGLFHGPAFFDFATRLEEKPIVADPALFSERREGGTTEYWDNIVDGELFCNDAVFINDGIPNLLYLQEYGVAGKPCITHCVTTRAVKAGETLRTFYNNHQVRFMPGYIEQGDAKKERVKFIRDIEAKSPASSLTLYEKQCLSWILASPYLCARWISLGEISLNTLNHLFQLGSFAVDEGSAQQNYMNSFEPFKLFGSEVDVAIAKQWIGPVLAKNFIEMGITNLDVIYSGIALALNELVESLTEIPKNSVWKESCRTYIREHKILAEIIPLSEPGEFIWRLKSAAVVKE